MNVRARNRLIRLYPRRSAARRDGELAALLDDAPLTLVVVADVVRCAALDHVRRRSPLTVVVALLAFALLEAIAVGIDVTDNVLWAPTTPARATMLAVTLAPLAGLGVTHWRHRSA